MRSTKKTFNFGKIDYLQHGRKDCAVDVTIELRYCGGEPVVDRNGKPTGEYCNEYIEFSAFGNIWNAKHSKSYSTGQNLDTIAKYVHNPIFNEIFDLWKKHNMNSMNAGTPEQEAAVKEWMAEGNLYNYTAACEMLESRNLYEVPLNADLVGTRKADGKRYCYGFGWVIAPIPAEDLTRIKLLLR